MDQLLINRLTPSHVLDVIAELCSRWHGATGSEHAAGRAEGYLQSIALLLDLPVAVVRAELTAGRL